VQRVAQPHLLQLVVQNALALELFHLQLLELDDLRLSRDLHDEGKEDDDESRGREETSLAEHAGASKAVRGGGGEEGGEGGVSTGEEALQATLALGSSRHGGEW